MKKLELSVEEVNYILNLMAQRPYNEVVALIAKIQSQLAEGETNEL